MKPLIGQSINERTFSTKIIKHPSDDVLKVIDRLAKRKLSQIENPNYLDIDVLLYTAAVTTKEYLNDLSKKYNEKNPKSKMPQWITNIEGKIIRIRRTIGHLTKIISCNRTGIFTNHQKKLKEKYCKKYGNTKLHTLNFKLTVLKHNLHATSVRLKYQKKSSTENLLIGSFPLIQKQFIAILKVTISQQKSSQRKKVQRHFGKESGRKKQLLTTM